MLNFFRKKSVWITAVVLIVIIGGIVLLRSNKKPTFKESYTVTKQDVKETVVATGTVTSQSNLNLSFKNSGVLSSLKVSVGDQVKAGTVMASLSQGDSQAAIDQANASLLSAQAAYEKLVNGASSTDVQQAQVALDNARIAYNNTVAQQKTLVANAQSALLNAGLAAIPAGSNSSTVTVTISGTYTGSQQGQYVLNIITAGDGPHFTISGLETQSTLIDRGVPQAMGSMGLFVTFSSSGTINPNDSWTVTIPNTQASTYLGAYNAYQAALQTQSQEVSTAQGTVNTAAAALNNTTATARPEDLKSAQASVDQAEAQLETARNNFADNEIVAPIDGTITVVNIKIGEQVTPTMAAISMQDVSNLHVESYVPESSINLVQIGLSIDMTFDALGPDEHKSGTVESIDPASTVLDNVIEFRVVSTLPPNDTEIKPGMTANLSIVIADKPDVLAVPNRLISTTDNTSTVMLLKGNKATTVNITTGLAGDNYTEVTAGISEGDVLVAND